MTFKEAVGSLLVGFAQGTAATIVVFMMIMVGVTKCSTFLEAHDPIDVRINENDRTITGLNYPGDTDALLQTYLYLDIYSGSAPTQDTTSEWDIDSFIACQNRNKLRHEHLRYNQAALKQHPLRETELIESNAELQAEVEVCTL